VALGSDRVVVVGAGVLAVVGTLLWRSERRATMR